MIGQSFHSAIRHNGALNQAVFCQDSSANRGQPVTTTHCAPAPAIQQVICG